MLFEVHGPAVWDRIIHQSWKTEAVPAAVRPWQESWRQLNPGVSPQSAIPLLNVGPHAPAAKLTCLLVHLQWSYKLWTDEANRRFVESHYNWWVFKHPLPALCNGGGQQAFCTATSCPRNALHALLLTGSCQPTTASHQRRRGSCEQTRRVPSANAEQRPNPLFDVA